MKKRRTINLLSALLTAIMAISIMTGCKAGQGDTATQQDNTSVASTQQVATKAPLEPVTLKFYFGGDKKDPVDKVWGAVSEYLKDIINAKFEINYTPFSDYVNKIMVMAAAGDNWDLNFAADWLGYAQLLNAGAFMPLNDLMPEFAPDLYAVYQSQGVLDAASVGDKIMCLPWTMKQNQRSYIMWRKDLSPEIQADSIKTIEDIEAMLLNAKAKFPDRMLFHQEASKFPSPIGGIINLKHEISIINFHGFCIDMNDPACKIIPYEQTKAFKEAVTIAKNWYDAGILQKDGLVDKTPTGTHLKNGLLFTMVGSNEVTQVNMDLANKGSMSAKEVRLERSQLYPDKKYYNRSPLANVYTIGANSSNPDRVLTFLNSIETDQTLYDLVLYGILGETYVLEGKEAKAPPEKKDAASNYLGWTSQWPLWKPQFMRPDTNYSEGFWAKQSEFASLPNNINSPLYGLFLNSEAIKTELSQRDQIEQEFGKPLMFGASKNVEKDLSDYIAKQKAAGLDRVVVELQKQVDAYLASQKK